MMTPGTVASNAAPFQIEGLDEGPLRDVQPFPIEGLEEYETERPKRKEFTRYSTHEPFWRSRKFLDAIIGGRNSGKSKALGIKCYEAMRENSGLAHSLVGQTGESTESTLLPAFIDVLESFGVRHQMKWKPRPIITLPNRAWVEFLSGENWEHWPGRNRAWTGLDEPGRMERPVLEQAIAMTRERTASLCQVALSGTPEGFNYLYDEFGNVAADDPRKDVIFVETDDNVDGLRPGYGDEIEAIFGSRLAEQYRRGRFVDVRTGKVYYGFSRLLNDMKETYDPANVVHVGLDFNVDPGPATISHQDGDIEKFVAEIFLRNTHTEQVCRAIIETLRGQQAPVYVYGDASGGARSANSQRTNWQIVEQMLRPVFAATGFEMRVRRANPSVVDRVNAMNRGLERRKVLVNVERCPNLMRDLEQVIWKKGILELEKVHADGDKDPRALLTHISDAAGYVIHYEHPIILPRGGGVYQARYS